MNTKLVTGILTLFLLTACNQKEQKSAIEKERKQSETAAETEKTDSKEVTHAEGKAGAKPLTVTVEQVNGNAPLVIRVYTEANFLEQKPDKFKFRVRPKGGRVTHTVKGMPYGNVAVVVYQDMNDNDDLDRNALGIPEEPYAFSNDFRPKVKAPDFTDCMFTYNKASNTVTINMPSKK